MSFDARNRNAQARPDQYRDQRQQQEPNVELIASEVRDREGDHAGADGDNEPGVDLVDAAACHGQVGNDTNLPSRAMATPVPLQSLRFSQENRESDVAC